MSQTPDLPEDPDRSSGTAPTDPFGGGLAGLGGFDLGAVLQQAQAMQEQLVAAQEDLADTEVTGSAGGVSVTLDGTGALRAVTIPPGAAQADDAESWTDLGDLVVAAYRDAKARVDDLAAQALGPLAGGGPDPTDLLGGLFGGGGQPGGSGDDAPRRSGF